MHTPAVDERSQRIDAILGLAPVVAILTIEDPGDAVPLARALVAGGLPVLEVTLRTPAALGAIARIAGEVPEARVGAGTVLDAGRMRDAAAAGAQFAIAPGATPALYEAAGEHGLPFLPGVATASELMAGLERGERRFKFFPAEASGGIAALGAWAAPFPMARFCPTGGIDAARAPAYLALPNVACVGGSWMVPRDALASRDWDRIGGLARAAAALRPLPSR